jgi:hypothetical protein
VREGLALGRLHEPGGAPVVAGADFIDHARDRRLHLDVVEHRQALFQKLADLVFDALVALRAVRYGAGRVVDPTPGDDFSGLRGAQRCETSQENGAHTRQEAVAMCHGVTPFKAPRNDSAAIPSLRWPVATDTQETA